MEVVCFGCTLEEIIIVTVSQLTFISIMKHLFSNNSNIEFINPRYCMKLFLIYHHLFPRFIHRDYITAKQLENQVHIAAALPKLLCQLSHLIPLLLERSHSRHGTEQGTERFIPLVARRFTHYHIRKVASVAEKVKV